MGPLTEWPTHPNPQPSPARGEEREGLSLNFYSPDLGRIWRVAEGLEYGIVGINEGIISTEITPSDMSYGLEVRSGLSVSRSTGTETCSWTMNHRPWIF
jgi:acyl-CoA reductase-like NAD-dependent aldehyde dehydrogenase